MQNFDLYAFIHNTVNSVIPKAREKGLELHYEIDNRLPRLVCSDPYYIKQIILNLLQNAIKFTEKGNISVRLIQLDNDTHNLESVKIHFMIEDTGIGIPDDKKHEIFEIFSQADNSHTRRFGGVGLGLSISQKLINYLILIGYS